MPLVLTNKTRNERKKKRGRAQPATDDFSNTIASWTPSQNASSVRETMVDGHLKRVYNPTRLTKGSTRPLTSAKVKVVGSLAKSHQIEGDGLLPLLYHHLYKKTWNSNKEFQSCPGARCPDTVVYEHNFPQHWYTFDTKHQEIQKRPGSFLDTAQILKFFSRPVTKRFAIVAQYIFATDNPATEEPDLSVEFFSAETLKDFLHNRKNHPDGILQRFVVPKGERNFQLQAIWSPNVTLVYKRTNNIRLSDRTSSFYDRAVTCDGPSHYTREDLIAEQTRKEVIRICDRFVQHFHSTEHKPISRLVMYFKVDDKDNVWILWASSLRIGQSKFSILAERAPVNLATNFVTPEEEFMKKCEDVEGAALDKKLLTNDTKQYELSSDMIFAATFCSDYAISEMSMTPQRAGCTVPSPAFEAINANGKATPSTQRLEPSRPVSSRSGRSGRARLRFRQRDSPSVCSADRDTDGMSYIGSAQASPSNETRSRVRDRDFVSSDRPPFLPSPKLSTSVPPLWEKANPFHRKALVLGFTFDEVGSQRSQRSPASGRLTQTGPEMTDYPTIRYLTSSPGGMGEPEAVLDPATALRYQAIIQAEEAVIQWAKDELYCIYSHTLNHEMTNSRAYLTQIPEDVRKHLKGANGECTQINAIASALGLATWEGEPHTLVHGRQVKEDAPLYYFQGYSSMRQQEGYLPRLGLGADRPMAHMEEEITSVVAKMFQEQREQAGNA